MAHPQLARSRLAWFLYAIGQLCAFTPINTRKPYSVVLQLINSFEHNSRFCCTRGKEPRSCGFTPESRAEEDSARKVSQHSSLLLFDSSSLPPQRSFQLHKQSIVYFPYIHCCHSSPPLSFIYIIYIYNCYTHYNIYISQYNIQTLQHYSFWTSDHTLATSVTNVLHTHSRDVQEQKAVFASLRSFAPIVEPHEKSAMS